MQGGVKLKHNANRSYYCLIAYVSPIPLSAVPLNQAVVVHEVRQASDIGLRLQELGFVAGERLRVVAHGFPGREPIAVRIGNTTFALRRFEADQVLVVPGSGTAA